MATARLLQGLSAQMQAATRLPGDDTWLSQANRILLLGSVVVLVALIFNYTLSSRRYHLTMRDSHTVKGQLPPRYPFLVPLLGPSLLLVWDMNSILHRMTTYAGRLTSVRVRLPGLDLYVLQDRETVARLWKHPGLAGSKFLYLHSIQYILGAGSRLMKGLRADDSGPLSQPHPGSNAVEPNQRLHHAIHDTLRRGLTGPCLEPMMRRFVASLTRRMGELQVGEGEGWVEGPDFSRLFNDMATAAVVESIFGPALLAVNPTFVRDLQAFDGDVPSFARGVPGVLMPAAHRNREALVAQVLRWYRYAREHFDEGMIYDDGDGDPVWGSEMIRRRQRELLQLDGVDDDALARLDLGLAWGAVVNAVPSASLAAFHILKDPNLLHRVRADVDAHVSAEPLDELDVKQLARNPLLSSVYAETLRLYIRVHAIVSSPHDDVALGAWRLPRGELAMLNSGLSHMDAEHWNTRGGTRPLSSFWAERFLVDPRDPLSGPLAPQHRRRSPNDSEKHAQGSPYFSTSGLEGSWFPYGGGPTICPGRHFAKFLMINACALLVHRFDVEIDSDTLAFDDRRDGFGVRALKKPLPYRIRKRRGWSGSQSAPAASGARVVDGTVR